MLPPQTQIKAQFGNFITESVEKLYSKEPFQNREIISVSYHWPPLLS